MIDSRFGRCAGCSCRGFKQVLAAEYNSMEFVRTHVLGAENVVQASLDAGVTELQFKY